MSSATRMSDITSLVRLLQLASPALPVGAYSYSQGLEAAIEAGIVHGAASAQAWIADGLALGVARMEAPVLLRLVAAWSRDDVSAVREWNERFVASRETAELRAETLQMGYSLRQLLPSLELEASLLDAIDGPAFPTAFAFAAARWRIDPDEALAAYLFAWIENQMIAALKCVPLGQSEGQRLLQRLSQAIPAAVDAARALGDDELTNFMPGLALASARHESQYSRLFRS